MATELFENNFAVQLTAGCANTDTTIQVSAAAPTSLQGGQFRILIDQEYMLVTGGQSTTTWTVSRGASTGEPTTPTQVGHQQGSWVTHIFTAGAVAHGIAGPAGATGATGATGSPGVGANWKGTWSSGTTYALGDGVVRNGLPYISNQGSNLNHDPATDTTSTWWTLINTGVETWFNVKTYGAVGNAGVVSDGAITSGQATLSSVSAGFTTADNGKTVSVSHAGAFTSSATLSTGLSTGAPITSLPVNSLAGNIPAGAIFTVSGTHIQQWVTTGASAGATSIPVSSQTPNFAYPSNSAVGQPSDLNTTISSVSGGVATLAASASNSVASTVVIYGTDDTSAIQSAIDACVNAGGGTVWFPPAFYFIAGALRTTPTLGSGTFCAQITLNNPTGIVRGLRLLGAQPMGLGQVFTGGSWLVSSNAGAAYSAHTALPAVVGCIENTAGFTYSNLSVIVENLAVKVPANPQITGLNLQGADHSYVKQSAVNTVENITEGVVPTQPTHKEGIGLVLSGLGISGATADNFFAAGLYCGVHAGEHSNGNAILPVRCWIGFSWQKMGAHAASFGYVNVEQCTYGLAHNDYTGSGGPAAMSPGQAWLTIEHFDTERVNTSNWYGRIADVADVDGTLYGYLNYTTSVGGSMDTVPPVVSGFTGLQLHAMNGPYLNATATTLTNSVDQAIAGDGAFHKVTWQANVGGAPTFDGLGAWSNSNPTRLTCQVAGVYLVEVAVQWSGGTGTYRKLSIVKTSPSSEANSGTLGGDLQPPGNVALKAFAIIPMLPTDYVEVQVSQDSGSNLNLDSLGTSGTIWPHFSIARIA